MQFSEISELNCLIDFMRPTDEVAPSQKRNVQTGATSPFRDRKNPTVEKLFNTSPDSSDNEAGDETVRREMLAAERRESRPEKHVSEDNRSAVAAKKNNKKQGLKVIVFETAEGKEEKVDKSL